MLLLAPGAIAAVGACTPDFGSAPSDGPGADAAGSGAGGLGGGGTGPSGGAGGGGPGGAPVEGGEASGGSGGSTSGPLCDNSPPSQNVDRSLWAEGYTYFFTPAGPDIKTLYVPANSMVHLKLAGTLNEEQHVFVIKIKGCETPPVGLGTENAPSKLDWKAPKVAGKYAFGAACDNHTGMDSDIVVTP